jgi:hypothetical protein
MEYERFYEDLFYNKREKFELMENTANALLLQFEEPIKYDLTIPSVRGILKLLNIFQDGHDGKIIFLERVNCLYPDYSDRPINFNFNHKNFKRIEEGLNLCFSLKSKYDTFPLELHLNWNKDIFGNEDSFYRFREGKRKDVEFKVNNYFKENELKILKGIGKFVQPYIENLDKSVTLNYY